MGQVRPHRHSFLERRGAALEGHWVAVLLGGPHTGAAVGFSRDLQLAPKGQWPIALPSFTHCRPHCSLLCCCCRCCYLVPQPSWLQHLVLSPATLEKLFLRVPYSFVRSVWGDIVLHSITVRFPLDRNRFFQTVRIAPDDPEYPKFYDVGVAAHARLSMLSRSLYAHLMLGCSQGSAPVTLIPQMLDALARLIDCADRYPEHSKGRHVHHNYPLSPWVDLRFRTTEVFSLIESLVRRHPEAVAWFLERGTVVRLMELYIGQVLEPSREPVMGGIAKYATGAWGPIARTVCYIVRACNIK